MGDLPPEMVWALIGAAFTAGSAIGGWVMMMRKQEDTTASLRDRVGDVEEHLQTGRTLAETVRWLEMMVDKHEAYFSALIEDELRERGVMRIDRDRRTMEKRRDEDSGP